MWHALRQLFRFHFVGSEGSNPNGRYADCCTLLIQGGAELETVDTSYGRTAAHWAVYYHRDDVLSVLIEGGENDVSDHTVSWVSHTYTHTQTTTMFFLKTRDIPILPYVYTYVCWKNQLFVCIRYVRFNT